MKVVVEYVEVNGCESCPFKYYERDLGGYFCGHHNQEDAFFTAKSETFPKGCPMAGKTVEKITKRLPAYLYPNYNK